MPFAPRVQIPRLATLARDDGRTSLILVTLLATVLTGVLPRLASAQRAAGSLGVALTVLPVAPQSVTVTDFRLDRNGMATVRATGPMTIGASQLVMMRISSPAGAFATVRVLPDAATHSSATDTAAREVAYRIEVGRPADGVAPRDVQLRLECLVVAGT